MKTITESVAATYRGTTATIRLNPISREDLTPGQMENAERFGATHCFRTPDVKALPKYQSDALKAAGWTYTKIGHTSYKSKTWGARKTA